jgi:predicted AlkP superfamily pyrophosphatase or phosphodiesterase
MSLPPHKQTNTITQQISIFFFFFFFFFFFKKEEKHEKAQNKNGKGKVRQDDQKSG